MLQSLMYLIILKTIVNTSQYIGPLCGSCSETTAVTVLRFKCLNISNCQSADSATYYYTVALGKVIYYINLIIYIVHNIAY